MPLDLTVTHSSRFVRYAFLCDHVIFLDAVQEDHTAFSSALVREFIEKKQIGHRAFARVVLLVKARNFKNCTFLYILYLLIILSSQLCRSQVFLTRRQYCLCIPVRSKIKVTTTTTNTCNKRRYIYIYLGRLVHDELESFVDG